MLLRHRSYQKELLDEERIPFADIKQNMTELNTINTLLGGHAITIKGFKELIGQKKTVSICEIGCGGGDNLMAIFRWCQQKNIKVHCIGIDLKSECIAVAREIDIPGAEWITSDYGAVDFTTKPDIIFSSLFCHHFTDEQLGKQLQWMRNNSRIGFFINDLHRNAIAYHAIRILTKYFSSSYLVKHDAPLSVARGFIKKEWEQICLAAGLEKVAIKWMWAFRYLITCKHA